MIDRVIRIVRCVLTGATVRLGADAPIIQSGYLIEGDLLGRLGHRRSGRRV